MVTGLGRIAASGPGAPLAAIVMGMMPGKLNDGEQDYLDRLRLEQMREAPTRVRYTWEQDDKGNPVPHGWHTPPGKDRVRVRKMAWDSGVAVKPIRSLPKKRQLSPSSGRQTVQVSMFHQIQATRTR